MIERSIGRALYEREVQQRLLALREDLVRHDENLAAWHLLDKAVPYFLRDDSQIRAAKNAQWQMVKHLFEPAVYEAYYGTNAHERPFEQQYRLEIEQADELPRVAWLKARIAQLWPDAEDPNVVSMLDLGANDGWLAAHIGLAYGQAIQFDCVDLHPDNVRGARARAREGAPIRKVWMVDACEQAPWKLGTYDGVVAFELIEHVAEPLRLLEVMAAAVHGDGRLFVSTPEGAVEGGNLPAWAFVEPKGHVRSLSEADLRTLCGEVGEVERLVVGRDGVMTAEVSPG